LQQDVQGGNGPGLQGAGQAGCLGGVGNFPEAGIAVNDGKQAACPDHHLLRAALLDECPVPVKPVDLIQAERAHRHGDELGGAGGEKQGFRVCRYQAIAEVGGRGLVGVVVVAHAVSLDK